LRTILESDGVVATSLHGVILAESFGVPVEWISSPPIEEGTFKFRDYFLSTGRPVPPSANSGGIIEALERLNWRRNRTSTSGKETVVWDPKPLWDAFPWMLFGVDAPACPFSNDRGMPGGQQNQEHPKCAA
jgi:pyruvyltransferase